MATGAAATRKDRHTDLMQKKPQAKRSRLFCQRNVVTCLVGRPEAFDRLVRYAQPCGGKIGWHSRCVRWVNCCHQGLNHLGPHHLGLHHRYHPHRRYQQEEFRRHLVGRQ
jgi:hypothetical protein